MAIPSEIVRNELSTNGKVSVGNALYQRIFCVSDGLWPSVIWVSFVVGSRSLGFQCIFLINKIVINLTY